jgi:hypothetical protein
MNMEREFTIFEKDMNCQSRKRFQSMNADEWRTLFAERMEKFHI